MDILRGVMSHRLQWHVIEHVRNQFKDALSEMVEVYQEEAFAPPDGKRYTGENGFSFCKFVHGVLRI